MLRYSIALSALAILTTGVLARADQPELDIVPDAKDPNQTGFLMSTGPQEKSVDCGPNDDACHKRLLWLEASVKILTFQAGGALTADGDGKVGGAVKFKAQVINGDTKSG